MRTMRKLRSICLAIALAVSSSAAFAQDMSVKVPPLNGTTMLGKGLFEKYCAKCHGPSLTGTKQGPPLLHPFYHPNHHSDPTFLLAVRQGVRQHHWKFGNMKPVPGLSDANVGLIVQYVRAMQKENGIF